jgi:hypothetical protein
MQKIRTEQRLREMEIPKQGKNDDEFNDIEQTEPMRISQIMKQINKVTGQIEKI